LGIGDWGLGIGDWAQSPIPNPHPQSPCNIIIVNKIKKLLIIYNFLISMNFKLSKNKKWK
jgi:hypothetical protein